MRDLWLTTHDGKSVQTHTAIIATGARANYLGLPSEDKFKNKGVSACAVCDGFLPRFRNQPIAVVGGGDTAVEEAAYLSKYGSKIHLLVRRDVLRASKVMADRAMANPKIEIRMNTIVREILDGGGKGEVTGAVLEDTTTGAVSEIPLAGVLVAIGHTPNTALFKHQLELDADGYIVTRDGSKTNIPGVFACGDVQDQIYRQAITAAGSGCMAALDAEHYLDGVPEHLHT